MLLCVQWDLRVIGATVCVGQFCKLLGEIFKMSEILKKSVQKLGRTKCLKPRNPNWVAKF